MAVTAQQIGMEVLQALGLDGKGVTGSFGPKSDNIQVIGLLEMGKQIILEAAMYPEP